MVKRGYLPPNTRFWLGDKTESIWLTVKRAINKLEKEKRLPPDSVDPEDALSTIGLWKSALIPPVQEVSPLRISQLAKPNVANC